MQCNSMPNYAQHHTLQCQAMIVIGKFCKGFNSWGGNLCFAKEGYQVFGLLIIALPGIKLFLSSSR